MVLGYVVMFFFGGEALWEAWCCGLSLAGRSCFDIIKQIIEFPLSLSLSLSPSCTESLDTTAILSRRSWI